ncbi:hypothetical protein [Kitasatospora fiedleri]|uniref:hypothetical protein n=1 Tax=Kitasatospora fiedleri TaxID=2991545 RepID=UPI00249A1E6F|nr:hypothetical protein [Kitasatospora fiedleri]
MVQRPQSARPATAASATAPLLAAFTASALLAGPLLLAAPAVAAPEPSSVDHHAVVLVNFRNKALTDAAKTRADAVRNFFGTGSTSLASYYARNSGGRMSVVPAKGDGVFGPFTIDMDDSAACDNGKMNELARKAIAGVPFDHISVVFHSDFCSNWWGLGSVSGPNSWFHEGAVDDGAAIIHEIGHNLGFQHQERQVCPAGTFTTGCTADEYSHRTPMGGGGEKKGLSAPELLSLQWLTAQQTTTPTAGTSVHLTPLHAPGTGGTRAIDLPLGTGGDRVVVEYRTPDPGTPDVDVPQGVAVYRVTKGNYKDAVLISNTAQQKKAANNSLDVNGPALTDDAAHLSVSVVGTSDTGADIRIRLGADAAPKTTAPAAAKPAATAAEPAATAEPAPSGAAPGPLSAENPDHQAADPADSASPAPAATATDGRGLAQTGGGGSTLPLTLGAVAALLIGAALFLVNRRGTGRRARR